MRIIIIFPCLLISLSTLCQTQPKLKNVKKTAESNKKAMAKNKAKPYKKSEKKFTVSKPTDHLLDLKHEPE